MNFNLNVSDMIDRIKENCSLKSLEPLGFLSGTISNWKTKNTFPRSNDLFRISQHIGVSMEWLLTGEKMYMDELFLTEDQQKQFILSSRERELIETFKKLNEKEKNAVSQLAKTLAEN
jgi:transcriptional regulator with XRE-family HTH domain